MLTIQKINSKISSVQFWKIIEFCVPFSHVLFQLKLLQNRSEDVLIFKSVGNRKLPVRIYHCKKHMKFVTFQFKISFASNFAHKIQLFSELIFCIVKILKTAKLWNFWIVQMTKNCRIQNSIISALSKFKLDLQGAALQRSSLWSAAPCKIWENVMKNYFAWNFNCKHHCKQKTHLVEIFNWI